MNNLIGRKTKQSKTNKSKQSKTNKSKQSKTNRSKQSKTNKSKQSKPKILKKTGSKKSKRSNNDITKSNTMEPKYIEHVSEPWFTLISLGLKKVEGRLSKGRFVDMQIGDIIKWTNDDFMSRSVLTKIIRKTKYNSFVEYLEAEGLDNALPGMPTIEHGLSVYYKYFTKEAESQHGVMAIELELI
jgi:ASC-1-like (ASCH) protein